MRPLRGRLPHRLFFYTYENPLGSFWISIKSECLLSSDLTGILNLNSILCLFPKNFDFFLNRLNRIFAETQHLGLIAISNYHDSFQIQLYFPRFSVLKLYQSITLFFSEF